MIRLASTTATYSLSRNDGAAGRASSPDSTLWATSRHTASDAVRRDPNSIPPRPNTTDEASAETTLSGARSRTALPSASMPPTYTPGSPGFAAIRSPGPERRGRREGLSQGGVVGGGTIRASGFSRLSRRARWIATTVFPVPARRTADTSRCSRCRRSGAVRGRNVRHAAKSPPSMTRRNSSLSSMNANCILEAGRFQGLDDLLVFIESGVGGLVGENRVSPRCRR